jgi:hypothetical protein
MSPIHETAPVDPGIKTLPDIGCSTPLGFPGTCSTIDACQPYLKMLQNPTHRVINFLKQAICDFNDGVPLLCCPPNNEESGGERLTAALPVTTKSTARHASSAGHGNAD